MTDFPAIVRMLSEIDGKLSSAIVNGDLSEALMTETNKLLEQVVAYLMRMDAQYQPDMTDCVRKSDFEFWETEQSISTEPSRLSSGYQLPPGSPIRDFFLPNATARYPNDRDPDAPNPYARNRFFEAERKRYMVNANNQYSNLQPQENTAAVDCQLTEPIIPTLTFNLGSTFTGAPEQQLVEMQAQLEQQLSFLFSEMIYDFLLFLLHLQIFYAIMGMWQRCCTSEI